MLRKTNNISKKGSVILEGNTTTCYQYWFVFFTCNLDKEKMDLNGKLCKAVQDGSLDGVEKLISLGACVDHVTREGSTPLSIAVQKGSMPLVLKLLDCGARDLDGAQKIAKANQNVSAIKILDETGKNRIGGSIQVPFFFDRRTGAGILETVKSPVYVDKSERQVRHLQLCMKVDHIGFLPFLIGDKDQLIHRRFDMDLKTYIELSKCKPFATYAIGNYKFEYLVEFYRTIFRDMVEFILYLHQINISISFPGFTIDNICVVKERIRFFALFLIDSTDASKKEDFRYLAALIKALIKSAINYEEKKGEKKGEEKKGEKIEYPKDLKAFLKILSSPCRGCDSLLRYHIAILSTKDRNIFMHNVSSITHYRSSITQDLYRQILQKMTLSFDNNDNWTTRFTESATPNGPVELCFKFGKGYSNRKWEKKGSILLFCRNMAEHLGQHFPQHAPPSKEDINNIILFYFGHELISFQTVANNEGVLGDFVKT